MVRNFQPGIIPGLLPTAEYTRRIMAPADIGHHGSLAAVVAARQAASKPSTIRTDPWSSC